MSRDPIYEYGGANLYSFVLNNPVVYVDALGRITLIDTIAGAVIGGAIGAVSSAITGGDIWAGAAGGAVAGACITMCPTAATQCGALGGAVSGYISGVRSAGKDKLCGARWHVRVWGSTAIGATTGAIFGRIGESLSEIGSWTRTIQTGSFSVSIEVSGPSIAASMAGGVSSSAAELVLIRAPEAILNTSDEIFREYTNQWERFEMGIDASGNF